MSKKKFLHEPKPGYIYVRKNGRYVGRIKAAPGTEDFDRQYWEILNGKSKIKTSISALISSYMKSERWAGLKASTRETYGRVLTYVDKKNGEKDATRVTRQDIVKARDANRVKRPKFARDLVAVMSVLYEHAQDIGWTNSNPAKGVRKPKIPMDRRRPHIPWTDEACAKFRAEAHRQALVVFELGIGSMQRPGDLVRFTWGHYDREAGALDVTQGKTNKDLWLPCSLRLRRVLDEEIERLGGDPHPSTPIIRGERDKPITSHGMSQMMRKERKRLGLLVHDQHAMRYRGIMELARAGCSDDEIMAYSGHDTKEMVIKYAGVARQRMRAATANEKRNIRDQG